MYLRRKIKMCPSMSETRGLTRSSRVCALTHVCGAPTYAYTAIEWGKTRGSLLQGKAHKLPLRLHLRSAGNGDGESLLRRALHPTGSENDFSRMNADCLQSPINLDHISCGWGNRKEGNFHFVIKF